MSGSLRTRSATKGKTKMRSTILLAMMCLFVPRHGFTQEQPQTTTAATPKADAPESYIVQLTEFRFKSSVNLKLSARDIVAQFEKPTTDGLIQPIETIRMSIQSGAENMVQFGRQVTVTTGTMTNAGKSTRINKDRTIGTILRVNAIPQDQKVQLTFTYESSRLDGDKTDDSPPDTLTTTISSMQLFELGKPTLVGGTSAGDTTYVILTIGR